MGAGASAGGGGGDDAESGPMACTLRALPEVIETVVFVREKWPLIVDPTGQAGRFLRYQRGSYLLADSPADITPDRLRQLLVGALKHGSTMVIAFSSIGGGKRDLEGLFGDTYFPRALVEAKQNIFKPEVWGPLLRLEAGDPPVDEFFVDGNFKFMVVSEFPDVDALFPVETFGDAFSVVRVGMPTRAGGASSAEDAEQADNDALASALGVKNVQRISKALVEAAFDGDLEEVTKLVAQGFSADSVDGRQHSAISEAACQGHNELLAYLLAEGADPNLCSDTGRSPLFRASFNGHASTLTLLLEAGGDPSMTQTSDHEGPYDVAKNNECREILSSWDAKKTVALKEKRKAFMRAELEKRLTTTAERDALARELIRDELVELASKGEVAPLQEKLELLAEEAEREGERRPRGCAESRDHRGCTLLMIAVEGDYVELVTFLLTHWKKLDEDNIFQDPTDISMEVKAFKTNVNARDAKGWNAACIASFRHKLNALRVLLAHGADAYAKNQYGKSAVDLAEDELDAAKNVYKDNSPVREVLSEFDVSKERGPGIAIAPRNGGGAADGSDGLPSDGTAMLMNIELNQEQEAEATRAAAPTTAGGGGKKGGKKGGGGAKATATVAAAAGKFKKKGGGKKK